MSINHSNLAHPGELDLEFGDNGRSVLPAFADQDRMTGGLCLAAGEHFFVAAHASERLIAKYALCKFRPDGALETSFGGNSGFILGEYPSERNAQGEAVRTQAHGGQEKIVLVGSAFPPQVEFGVPVTLWVSRFSADGLLDPGFADQGHRRLDVAGHAYTQGSAALFCDDQYTYVSATFQSLTQAASFVSRVFRLDLEGNLDPAFNGTGFAHIQHSGSPTRISAMAVLPRARILLAGSASMANGEHGLFASLNNDGTPDRSFGDGGYAAFQAIGLHTELHGLVITPDGKPLAVGRTRSENSTSDNLGLVYRLSQEGQPDIGFNQGNPVLTSLGHTVPGGGWLAAILDSSSLLVTLGAAPNVHGGESFVLGRYSIDGALDPSFGVEGLAYVDQDNISTIAPYSLIQQAASRRLVVGLNYLSPQGFTGHVVGVHGMSGADLHTR